MNKIDFTLAAPLQNTQEASPIATSRLPRPIPYTASTLTRLNAKASDGGCCGWINQIWQWILRLFGASPAPEATTITGLESRIERGKRIIDNHFQSSFIVNGNSPRSAIVVVMKYNGLCKVSFGSASDQRNSIDVTKALLRELLTRGEAAETKLEIDTMLFEKNPDNSFNYWHTDDSINFDTGHHGSGSGSFPGIDPSRALRILWTEIPDQEYQRNVGQYLIRQL
jgi:hypothetical protein